MIEINSLFIIITWIFIVIFSAIICRRFLPKEKELSRKIVHIGTGPIILLAWLLNISSQLAIPIASLITIALIINNQFKLLPALEDVKRRSYGTVFYGVSITILLIFLWPNNAAAVSAGVLIMAFGDGLAGLIGPKLNSPSWLIFGQKKSILGTLIMALSSSIILILIATLNNEAISTVEIILIASLATLLEQMGPWGIDNITVPIGVAFAWILLN